MALGLVEGLKGQKAAARRPWLLSPRLAVNLDAVGAAGISHRAPCCLRVFCDQLEQQLQHQLCNNIQPGNTIVFNVTGIGAKQGELTKRGEIYDMGHGIHLGERITPAEEALSREFYTIFHIMRGPLRIMPAGRTGGKYNHQRQCLSCPVVRQQKPSC